MAAEMIDRTQLNGGKDANGPTERPTSVEEEAAPSTRRGGRRVSNPEIIALDTILSELEALSSPSRARVAAYLWGWCQEQMGVAK